MEFELNQRGKKYKEEQSRLRDQARKKREAERQARSKQQQVEKELQERLRLDRLEKQKQEEAAEAERLEHERLTGGVEYDAKLQVVPSVDEGDKLVLPTSALAKLLPQDGALHEGAPIFFEVTTDFGTRTHAGVREFTAEEGKCGIPPKVARSLCHSADKPLSSLTHVRVRYVKLPKGRFAKLQPLGEGFQDHDLDVKALLEKRLSRGLHVTLSVGDVLQIRHDGMFYPMAVRELQPEPQVSIINADLEVEFMVSEAAQKAQQAEAAAQEEKQRQEEAAAVEKSRVIAWLDQLRMQLQQLDAAAGAGATGPKTVFRVRLPEGASCSRSFPAASTPLSALFAFVCVSSSADKPLLPPFNLVSTYPRRVYTCPTFNQTNSISSTQEISLAEAGLSGKQVSLLVEAIAGPVANDTSSSGSTDSSEEAMADGTQAQEKVSLSPTASPTTPSTAAAADANQLWQAAQTQLSQQLDQPSPSSRTMDATEVKRLEHYQAGMEVVKPVVSTALSLDEKWAEQLSQLGAMGFHDIRTNVRLLERHQGRILRVVTQLAEMQEAR